MVTVHVNERSRDGESVGAESDFLDRKPANAAPRRRASSRNLHATSDTTELQPEPGTH